MEYAYLHSMDINAAIKFALGSNINGTHIYKLPLHVVQNNNNNNNTNNTSNNMSGNNNNNNNNNNVSSGTVEAALFQTGTPSPADNVSHIDSKPLILPNVCKRQLDFDSKDVENNNSSPSSGTKVQKRAHLHASKCKTKSERHENYKYTKPQTASVVRRNQRERNRVRLINTTFGTLRDHIPQYALPEKQTKKMSKADILKSAIDYIHDLEQLLSDTSTGNDMPYVTTQSISPDVMSGIGSLDSPSSGTLSDCPSPIEDDIDSTFLDLVHWLQ